MDSQQNKNSYSYCLCGVTQVSGGVPVQFVLKHWCSLHVFPNIFTACLLAGAACMLCAWDQRECDTASSFSSVVFFFLVRGYHRHLLGPYVKLQNNSADYKMSPEPKSTKWRVVNGWNTNFRWTTSVILTQLLQHWFHQSISFFEPIKHEFWASCPHRVFLRLGDEGHGATAATGDQEHSVPVCSWSFPIPTLWRVVIVWPPGLHLHSQHTRQDV